MRPTRAAAALLLAACGPSDPPTTDETPAVCDAWREAWAAPSPEPWDGDADACAQGTPPPDAAAAVRRRLDFVRGLVGLPPVDALPGDAAQACALLMQANQALAHQPPDTWRCYGDEAAETARLSLLATLADPDIVTTYLLDFGHEATLGHRRWLLSPWLTAAGFGATERFSCLEMGLDLHEAPGWIAWPPPGDAPAALHRFRDERLDAIGWSLQSDTLDLATAQVQLRWGDQQATLPVEVLPAGLGSGGAIRFVPPEPIPAGAAWEVTVDGAGEPIRYGGRAVACEGAE